LAVSLAQALDTPAELLMLINLLMMNAGDYRFSDFLRVGTPLFLNMWSALSFLLAWRYGLL